MDWNTAEAGSTYKNFKITKNENIPEINSRLIELTHIATGASVMHIANDDPENLFCLSFQTIPSSSNGIAHVLEHTVLCGSKKFPVHDPFFCMARRSLNTYMNALTGSDFTCYPAATQIKKDFYNLLDVYLDSAFYPKLDFFSFLQEGHRLSFADENNLNSPLIYKGIVFNEMKGALSSPNARLNEAINQNLFPETTYGVNSGGDPKDIPSLTHEELKKFHSNYYHPSRCLFFFYGSFPLDEHLEFISGRVLDHCEKQKPLEPVAAQKRFHQPRRITATYPQTDEDNPEGQAYLSFAWLTTNVLNQEEILALSIADIALMDTDASPLKKEFMKTGLCSQAYAYLDPDIYDVPFVITLKGCNASKADVLEKILFDTIQSIVKNGIPKNQVRSAMHQLEFHRSEITGDGAPHGLNLFMRSALIKLHGANPNEGLCIHSLFKRLKEKIKEDERYFEKLIQKYFIDNNHFLRVVMTPDPKLPEKEAEQEEERLKTTKEKLSKQDLDEIFNQEKQLQEFQEEQDKEDPNILPKLSITDIPKIAKEYPLEHQKHEQLDVYHHDTFTNSIVYADLIWNIPKMQESDMWLLRLYTTILPQMGAGGRDYQDNLEFIQENLGGFGTSLSLNIQADDCNQYSPTFHVRGKSLYRKSKELFQLLYDTTQSVDFNDKTRLKEVFLKHFNGLQSSITQSSLRYAISLSASGLTEPAKLNNLWSGLDYYKKIRQCAKDYQQQESFIIEKLMEIHHKLQQMSEINLVLSCDDKMYASLKASSFYDLKKLQTSAETEKLSVSKPSHIQSHAKLIASPIAFTSKVFHTIPYTHPDAPALGIAANLFDHLTLHRLLREQRGAYGGGATYNGQTGNFSFYSYRDPNIATTIQAFNQAVSKVLDGKFDDFNIEQAIFEKFQSIDAPISPGSQGRLAHGWLQEGKTLERRQSHRDKLLSLTKNDIISATEKHIATHMHNGATIVFAGQELIDKENERLKHMGIPIFEAEKI
ncbi:MAG: insulinase family protein [Chlamydiota bacterium]